MSRVVCVLGLVGSSWGLPNSSGLWRRRVRSAHKETQEKALSLTRASEEYWVTQRLDHTNGADERTFQQRYFANATWFAETGPVFLCVGGEGPALDETVLYDSVHCNDMTELAPRAGAMLFALEHRYYGKSVPREATRAYLSSHQAVYDIAAFVEFARAKYNLTADNKWVTWGGSYPGMVSGFARLKLPHLIFAAVSSSAPWQAQVDMRVYNDLVGRSLSLPSVGGSDECLRIVSQGHASIKALIMANDTVSLAETFDFCDPTALDDRAVAMNWAGYGVIDVPSQENDPSTTSPASNIDLICRALKEAPGSELDKLANVSALQNNATCLRVVADDAPSSEQLEVVSDALSWPWQTCTQFGFYQTCEADSECPFAKGFVTLDDEIRLCQRAFNISADTVRHNVRFTNAVYGGSQPQATRVIYVNGDVDPWSGLGVLQTPSGSVDQPTLMVHGSSHHFWTHPADTIVQDTVKAAKRTIQDQVLAWLDDDHQ